MNDNLDTNSVDPKILQKHNFKLISYLGQGSFGKVYKV